MVKIVAYILRVLLSGDGVRAESLPLVVAYLFLIPFVTIGMVLEIFPVVGIHLLFFSYEGFSTVVLMMLGVGFLMNVSMRGFLLKPLMG